MSPNRPVRRRIALLAASTLMFCAAGQADTSPSIADDPRVQDATQLWQEWMAYRAIIDQVPGVSFGIVHDQELIASGGLGAANPAEGLPATPDTLYSICSISKLFTSVGLMQQREAGKVRLDDPVAEHLDWFEALDIVHPDSEAITVRGLLTHSAGLPRESDFPYWTDADYPFPTAEAIRERLDAQETLYPASTYFQYSNLGLTMVGNIVEEVSGMPYDRYIRERILEPLDMDSTSTDMPVEERGRRLAIGHSNLKRDGERDIVAPFQTRGIAPAAGFASNVNDLARFAMWQFRVLDGEDQGLLRAASLREMQRVQWVDPDWNTTWGLGFSVRKEGDRTYARHGGGCPGYYTEFRLEPKTRIGVIVLTNTIGSAPGFYAQKAFELVGPAIATALASPDEAPQRLSNAEAYTGLYDSIWDQVAIVPWEDGLAALEVDSPDPAGAMMRLKPAGEHTFHRVREDDGSPGEQIIFELGDDGKATRFYQHSIWRERIAP